MSTKAHDDLAEAEAAPTLTSNDAALERTVVRKMDRNFLLLLWVLCRFFAGQLDDEFTLLMCAPSQSFSLFWIAQILGKFQLTP